MAGTDKALYGRNVRTSFFVGGQRVPGVELATTVKQTEAKTMIRRGYLGKKRLTTDSILDGYDISMSFDVRNGRVFDMLKERDDALDNNQDVPELTVMIVWTLRDGTQVAYMYGPCEGKCDFDGGQHGSEATYSVELQAEERTKVS